MNYKQEITQYIPQNAEETVAKEKMVQAIAEMGDAILNRNTKLHLVSSGVVLNPTLDKMLMVYHKRYQSFSWTGGHADGDTDPFYTALREVKEETSITKIYALTEKMISIEFFEPYGHLNTTYGFLAPENQAVFPKPDENTDVKWIPVDELEQFCAEKQMIPIYQKIIARMRQIREQKIQQTLSLFVEPLLIWYERNARILPWRENSNAYWVWISEIMLQQTRVEAVKPYFIRFVTTLPTIQSLAEVSEEQLLKLWEGLGYYTRVRNLQKTAQMIMTQYQGQFPSDYDTLLTFPGIGEYTAGAISSIVFGHPTPAIDGNVIRVMARLTDCWERMGKPKGKQTITQQLTKIYPKDRSGDFTQSLMELGATICLPNGQPKCEICPLSILCQAYQNGTMNDLPQKEKKKARKVEQKTVFILEWQDKIALHKREKTGLLAGLWEFPNTFDCLNPEDAKRYLQTCGIIPESIQFCGNGKHIFSHIEWHMVGYRIKCQTPTPQWEWVSKERLLHEITLPSAWNWIKKLL